MLPAGKSISVSVAVALRACVRAKLCAGAKGDVFPKVKAKKLNFVVCPAGRPAARPPECKMFFLAFSKPDRFRIFS